MYLTEKNYSQSAVRERQFLLADEENIFGGILGLRKKAGQFDVIKIILSNIH